MHPLLRDLYGHQVWADAEHWRAIGAHAAARDDKAIRDRLHHITIVQRAFLWAVGDRQDAFAFTKPEDFPSLDALLLYAREHHDRLAPAIAAMSDARLAESIPFPGSRIHRCRSRLPRPSHRQRCTRTTTVARMPRGCGSSAASRR